MTALMLPDPAAPERPQGPRQLKCRRVSRERFVRLLISRKKLQRSDDPAAGIVGLLDESAGIVYVIERNELD